MDNHSIDELAAMIGSTRTDLHDLIAEVHNRLDGISERLDRLEMFISGK
jgi:hypothetical protein